MVLGIIDWKRCRSAVSRGSLATSRRTCSCSYLGSYRVINRRSRAGIPLQPRERAALCFREIHAAEENEKGGSAGAPCPFSAAKSPGVFRSEGKEDRLGGHDFELCTLKLGECGKVFHGIIQSQLKIPGCLLLSIRVFLVRKLSEG